MAKLEHAFGMMVGFHGFQVAAPGAVCVPPSVAYAAARCNPQRIARVMRAVRSMLNRAPVNLAPRHRNPRSAKLPRRKAVRICQVLISAFASSDTVMRGGQCGQHHATQFDYETKERVERSRGVCC